MTSHVKIHGIVPRIQYTANGSLTTYEFPFPIFSTADIEVYLNDIKQASTTYTITGVRNSDGGSVIFVSAPENGTIITIMRNLSIERISDFQEGGTLRADTLNDELDYQIACQQQIADNLNRSMVLPPYTAGNDIDLALPAPSAGKAVVWNSSGTALENSTVEVNALESTLKGYKESAESAANTATTKAGIASDKADIATAKAAEATSTLSGKANKDMDNLSTLGKKKIVNLAMPSDDYVDLVLSSSGSTYTASANGYFAFGKKATATGQRVAIFNRGSTENTVLGSSIFSQGSDHNLMIFMPVKKDDVVIVSYTTEGDTIFFRFVYAEGEI